MSYPNGEALLEEALRLGQTLLGRFRILNLPVNMAWSRCIKPSPRRKNTTVSSDVHCERLMMSNHALSKPLLPRRTGSMGARVTASHTTAMHSYNGAYTSRLFRLLKMSGINFVANPLVNIHLRDVSIRIKTSRHHAR